MPHSPLLSVVSLRVFLMSLDHPSSPCLAPAAPSFPAFPWFKARSSFTSLHLWTLSTRSVPFPSVNSVMKIRLEVYPNVRLLPKAQECTLCVQGRRAASSAPVLPAQDSPSCPSSALFLGVSPVPKTRYRTRLRARFVCTSVPGTQPVLDAKFP